MTYKKGKIVPKPEEGTREVLTPRAPFIGDTEVNVICGNCNTMLIKGYSPTAYKNVIIQCVNCEKYNEI